MTEACRCLQPGQPCSPFPTTPAIRRNAAYSRSNQGQEERKQQRQCQNKWSGERKREKSREFHSIKVIKKTVPPVFSVRRVNEFLVSLMPLWVGSLSLETEAYWPTLLQFLRKTFPDSQPDPGVQSFLLAFCGHLPRVAPLSSSASCTSFLELSDCDGWLYVSIWLG